MRVLITGGAGFLGTLLARQLLRDGLGPAGSDRRAVDELLLADLFPPHASLADEPRVTALTGELEGTLADAGPVDVVFHLAGVVSSAAEADFDLGLRTNLDGTRALLEWARHGENTPVLVFTSSLAVFGADPAIGAVGVVTDDTLPRPQSSYGTQKFIGEQLVADYTRVGFVQGRSVRLMTVSVRPGRPNAAASSFLSGIIREPLAGERANCPVPAGTAVALSSPTRTIAGIIRAAEASDADWGSRTAMNLPAITTTPAKMLAALDRVAGRDLSSLVDWDEQPDVAAIVRSWPAEFVTDRATSLGLGPDADVDEIVQEYIATLTPRH
ncbi:NAD-dependent epimerase/dehydratase family protein [Microbacter sp. GSS18]|nr:NAD-dependent epimerase/dehydratase family protein [Microbacter sp. GSS18]